MRLSRAVSWRAFNTPVFIFFLSHTSSRVSFIRLSKVLRGGSRGGRSRAVSRDGETTFRKSFDSLSLSSHPSRFPFFSFFLFLAESPAAKYPRVGRRKFMIYVRTGLSGETSLDGYLRENIRTRERRRRGEEEEGIRRKEQVRRYINFAGNGE